MAQKNDFQGWMGLDKDATGNMKWQSFEPKPWEETDVEIKVTHCGLVVLVPRSVCLISNLYLAFVHQIITPSDLDGVQPIIPFASATRLLVRPSE